MRILAGATTALRRIVDLGLVALIILVLVGIVLGKGVPLVGRQSIVIGGGSMEPTLGLGSAIVIRPVDPASLAVGDIVSMQVGPERTTYTHRIVAVVDRADGRWIRTKGDANAAPDPTLVPAGAVLGRVELVIPYAGYLLALLSLPLGVMFVLGLAATLLAIAWLLESLELEPHRAVGPAAADEAATATPARDEATAAADMAHPDAALRAGEPIAARPAPGAPGRGAPSWSFATPTFNPTLAGPAGRLAVRERIERSRDVRRRRATWQPGRGRDPRAID